MTQTQDQRITLYYREGSSDKVYQAAIEPSGPGFIVTFAYGRRGATLQTGTKTNGPVGFDEAKRIFDKLVKEKTAKGYTPGEDGTPYQQTAKQERSTGILPQLLNSIEEHEAQRYIADTAWWAQEKFDGRRIMIRRTGDQIIGINRLGLSVDLPKPIVDHAQALAGQHWLIDGEAVGDVLHAFDILESACADFRSQPYVKRLRELERILGTDQAAPVRVVPTAKTATAKQKLLGTLKGASREGMVFKRHLAPYTAGRPASGGDQIKLKFTAACSCIVAGSNGSKRSVRLELLGTAGKRVAVGNVTIPANQVVPNAGQIVEVRYLYAYPGGSLYQPVCRGVRDDIPITACSIAQLKYRAETVNDDEN